jgi:glutathione S-transferase
MIYTYPGSPICRAIAMFIADHEMDVEQKVVDLLAGEQFEPAFTATKSLTVSSPMQRIPDAK